MATRCCSARCSAERKGFRRELDSWRHKLIHCVGFESILEGIYGPRLLQDLSIFDNCEPEATADWSTDACCSFCNLQFEKISDRLPDSPPHAETPPQGINTSDTLQCQADQFLHAVLHKKEFPESCDPIIPLAAQELMRKMIRQFAVEYAHKIQTAENQNAVTQTEPDGPLDLTLSRNTQCAQQDGVLDLSKKNTPSLNTLAQQRLSGCLETKEEECRTKEREEGQERRGTALEEVMTSLCAHHRVLLLRILEEMTSFPPKDERGAVATQRDVRGTAGTPRSERGGHCCHTDESLCVLSSCIAAGCVCPCRLGVCALHSVCLCMNSCSGFSCRSITLGCAGCCARSRILVCQHTHSSDITNGRVTHSRCHSPSPPPLSPPPLSPKPQDAENSRDPDMPTLNTHTLNTQPPPLLPHNTHTDQTLTPETHTKPEHFIDLMDKFTDRLMEASEREWNVHTHTGDSEKVCDDTHLTEIITTVLHRSSERDYNLKELFEQHLASEKRSPQTRSQRRQEVMQAISRSHDQPATRRQSLQIKRDLARLEPDISRKKKRKTQLITHSTHNESPDTPISPAQSPDTPISPAQSPDTPISPDQSPDTPISPAQSPDTPISPAQSPDTPISPAQSPDTPISPAQSPDTPISPAQSPDTPISPAQSPDTPNSHAQSPDTPISPAQSPDTPNSQTQSPDTTTLHTQRQDMPSAYSNVSETCTEKAEPCGTLRSRRNIVRPQHLSSYVTEPRKMFYAACRSAKTNSTPTHGTDTTEPPPSAVIEQLKTPPVSPNKRIVCKEENSGQSHAERRLRVKTRRSEDVTRSPSPAIVDSTDTDDVKYVSPIKLMLVSAIKDEDGVKYTLRAAQPHNDEESFDPCVEESWAGNTIKEQAKEETIQTVSNESFEKLSTEESTNTEGLSDCVNIINETEPTIKRRPGRPKKLKAPMEKAVKRPIGRPRKSKPVDTNAVPSENTEKQRAEDVSSGEDGNKNLKITITYGRRKARRMVCEGQVPTEQSKGNGALTQSSNAEENAQSTQAQVSMNKDQFSLVMPVEDRKSLTHSIMCPKQSEGAGTRRPGRPAKVKISGISVTVTTVSPRQRKIHMKRDVREPAIQRRALMTELEPNEEPETITEETQNSVRHSVRERKPSVHLMRCVAMSRSNTPTPRTRKLLLNKANEPQQETKQHEPKDANDTKTRPNTSPQDAVHFSAVSVESLFDANLQWWPTSASPETLKEEMDKRLKLMKDTWVSDTSDVTTTDEDNGSAPSSSAVRMLFERDCSMETICSWFMQTTETQSLAIVKKANNRNPCEVFQYSSVQASDRPNVCSSPQAERLRKCVKKFATVVPKSPTKLRRAQAKVCGTQNCFTKQHIFSTTNNDTEKSQQCGAWRLYRTALDRARSRFKSRTKNTDVEYKSLNEQEESGIQSVSVSEHGLLNIVQSQSRRTSAQQKQVTANAWSAHTLRECKVFLRKLNSANTRSLSEESNDCTVRFSVSPAGGGSVQHREQGVRKSIKLKKMSNSGISTRQRSKVNRKRRHSCTNVLPSSPKRQRSSRGVMAAKWSDFILGPAR